MVTYQAGTIARCNRCQGKFELVRDRAGYELGNKAAARLTDFATCPHCDCMDCHWVYKSDEQVQPSH
jgi:uncharacterized protein with PIN domain